MSALPPLDPAQDSWAVASGDPIWPPNHKIGTALDTGGVPMPVLWTKAAPMDTVYQPPTVLPTLGGGTGEALCISDAATPRVAGASTTMGGVEKAVVWSQDGNGVWSVMTLPHYAAGLAGRALGLCDPDTVCIVGYCVTAVNDTTPQAWLSSDGGITWSRTALPLPPSGTDGQANEIIITHTHFLAAGWYDSSLGYRHAVRWESTDGGGTWMEVDLGPLGGLYSSEANDIMWPDGTRVEAVGRSWNPLTPGSGAAGLWIDEGMGIMAHDLNDLVANSPGLDLRNAHGIVWDPDDDLRAIVGDGTDVAMSPTSRVTGPHAWVAIEVGPTSAIPGQDSGEPALRVTTAPNPFLDRTYVSFVTRERSFVRVTVRDVAGRRIATLAASEREAGRHLISWNGHDARDVPVTPGVYLVEVDVGGAIRAAKVVRLR